MQNNAKKDKKRAARANLFFLLIRKKSVLHVQVFFLITSIDLDAGTDAMRQQENEMKSLQKAFNNFHLVKVSRYLMQYFY